MESAIVEETNPKHDFACFICVLYGILIVRLFVLMDIHHFIQFLFIYDTKLDFVGGLSLQNPLVYFFTDNIIVCLVTGNKPHSVICNTR